MVDFQHMVDDRTNLFPRGLHDGVAGRWLLFPNVLGRESWKLPVPIE